MESRLRRDTMERKIIPEEIEQLHLFVRKHYVEFYDVELELVDHLANDIEEQWREDRQLTFEFALNKAFKKFGIFGFSDVVEQKVNKLSNAYYKESFKRMKSFFTPPKLVVSLALFLVLFVGFKQVKVIALALSGDNLKLVGFLFLIYQFIQLYINKIKQNKSGEKKWLLDRVLFNLEIWPYYLLTLFVLGWLMPRYSVNQARAVSTFLAVLSALWLTLTILYVYVLKAIVVPHIKRELQEQKNRILAI